MLITYNLFIIKLCFGETSDKEVMKVKIDFVLLHLKLDIPEKKIKKVVKKVKRYSTIAISLVLINSKFSEMQLQDIKKESLQYVSVAKQNSYCMIHNQNR